MPDGSHLPDPALVVLVGASGSGKSTWAQERYRADEIVSSDDLRAVVGSGRHDLDASADAFSLLEQIVAGRLRRGLATVVDTLGFDVGRRRGWLDRAHAAGLPASIVLFDTPAELCRQRNADRERPVPVRVLTEQLRASRRAAAEIDAEGWDVVVTLAADEAPTDPADELTPPVPETDPRPRREGHPGSGLCVVLQVSRFPWGEDPGDWLRAVAQAAADSGFQGISLMDHLIQIPQVGTAWEPIPEPWVSLGMIAGLDTDLRLGTLVSPVTFRPPGILAKTAATLDVLSRGRAFLGLGTGWWQREHAAFGLPFPSTSARLDLLEQTIETVRALWASGTKPHDGPRVTLPETTSYPRPVSQIPIIVGGGGERRTLRIAAELADGCNVRYAEDSLDKKIAVLRRHCADVGRDPGEVAVTVLDLPVVGRDRDDVWARVERLRGRSAATTYAARHHAGTPRQHRVRYERLAEKGVRTVFVALPDLTGPDDVMAAAGIIPR